jgi:TPR repeat protein
MSSRIKFPEASGAAVGLLLFCLASFAQDSNTYALEREIDSSPISKFNAGTMRAERSVSKFWNDTIYNDAFSLYKRGQYAQAASTYMKACPGFAKACTNLGFMYSKGQGVKMSHPLAAEYYKRGCDAGNPLGCTNLGIMYYNGDLPRDDGRAVELFERSCRSRDSAGCRDLGYMYKHGYGVPKDETRATEQYQLADQLSHVHRIPFHVEGGLVLVSLNIQEENAILVIDTGSARTALNRKFLPPGRSLWPNEKVSTVFGDGQAYTIDVFWKLDGREIRLPALVANFNFPKGTVGLLGADILGTFSAVSFDYVNMILILED